MRKSGIIDENGVEIKEGDMIQFYYIDPMGKMHREEKGDLEKVVYKYGAFGYDAVTKFVPLFYWNGTTDGGYIPNKGTKHVYTNEYPFYVVP